MKVYQLSKSNGMYWWTGTLMVNQKPQDTKEYKYTTCLQTAKQLSGKRI